MVRVMAEEENIALVQKVFSALTRGDFPTAFGSLADDVDYRSPVTRSPIPEVSWSSPRRGPAEVAEFFAELGRLIDVQPFEILDISATGDKVFVEGKNRGIVRSNGCEYEHDWVMVIMVRDGKITRVYHYYNSADLLPALRGECRGDRTDH